MKVKIPSFIFKSHNDNDVKNVENKEIREKHEQLQQKIPKNLQNIVENSELSKIKGHKTENNDVFFYVLMINIYGHQIKRTIPFIIFQKK